jgi:hypothetical protein
MTTPVAPTPLPPVGGGNHGNYEDAVRELVVAPPPHVHQRSDVQWGGTDSQVVTGAGNLAPMPTGGTGGGTPTVVGRTDLYPEDFGYSTGLSAANKQATLQDFLNNLTSGKTGVIRSSLVYEHNNVLAVPTSCYGGRLIVVGDVRSTVQTASAFKVQADDFVVEGPGRFVGANVTSRGNTINHQKFVLDECSGARVSGITSEGSHGTGFFAYGASEYLVEDMTVRNTQADAFHNTHGSTYGKLRGCTAYNPGDDGMAVVSYFSADPVITSYIDVQGFRLYNGGARGVAVVGGTNIRYSDIKMDRVSAAGVYIAVESSFNSWGTSKVHMSDIYCYQPNFSGTDHGAVVFYSSVSGRPLEDVAVDRMTAEHVVRDTGTFPSGWLRHITANGGVGNRLAWHDIMLRGAGPSLQIQGNMPTTSWKSTAITRQAW